MICILINEVKEVTLDNIPTEMRQQFQDFLTWKAIWCGYSDNIQTFENQFYN